MHNKSSWSRIPIHGRCLFIIGMITCWFDMNVKTICDCIVIVFILFNVLSSLSRLRFVTDVFAFNASFNNPTPSSPMKLSVCLGKDAWYCLCLCVFLWCFTTEIKFRECCICLQQFTQWCCSCIFNLTSCFYFTTEWIVDGCLSCVFFILSSPPRSRSVSVVFDISASPNDDAPASPMLFPVDAKRKEKEWFVDGCLLCVFFLLYYSPYWVWWAPCLISVPRSMMLHLFLQPCSL